MGASKAWSRPVGAFAALADRLVTRLKPEELAATVEVPTDRIPIGRPTKGPQSAAYLSLADELFFGGGGGGGKTFLDLLLACNEHRSSIIFRRELRQFAGPDGIIATARRLIGDRGKVTNDGATIFGEDRAIEWGAMAQPDDWGKYKGRPHDGVFFDELPEFLEMQYRSVQAWARTTIPGQRVRTVATGNPPTTPEGEWVIRYWAPWLDPTHPHPAKPGELRWYAVVDGKDVERPDGRPFEVESAEGRRETIRPRSRTFIPALVEDNPYLMASGYDQVLNSLPEPLRSQMRWGRFDAAASDDPWQIIPTAWVRAAMSRWTPARPNIRVDDVDRPLPMSALGADISRGGGDATTLAPRYGYWIDQIEKVPGAQVPNGQAAARLIGRAIDHDKTILVNVDVIGIGASAYDQCCELGYRAAALNSSATSHATDRSRKLTFVNKRAEWHWNLREALDPDSGQALALPPDTELLADLCATRWKMTPRGVQAESKEDVKKRIGRSPDKGEAVIYAFVPAPLVATGRVEGVGRDGPSPYLGDAPQAGQKPTTVTFWRE